MTSLVAFPALSEKATASYAQGATHPELLERLAVESVLVREAHVPRGTDAVTEVRRIVTTHGIAGWCAVYSNGHSLRALFQSRGTDGRASSAMLPATTRAASHDLVAWLKSDIVTYNGESRAIFAGADFDLRAGAWAKRIVEESLIDWEEGVFFYGGIASQEAHLPLEALAAFGSVEMLGRGGHPRRHAEFASDLQRALPRIERALVQVLGVAGGSEVMTPPDAFGIAPQGGPGDGATLVMAMLPHGVDKLMSALEHFANAFQRFCVGRRHRLGAHCSLPIDIVALVRSTRDNLAPKLVMAQQNRDQIAAQLTQMLSQGSLAAVAAAAAVPVTPTRVAGAKSTRFGTPLVTAAESRPASPAPTSPAAPFTAAAPAGVTKTQWKQLAADIRKLQSAAAASPTAGSPVITMLTPQQPAVARAPPPPPPALTATTALVTKSKGGVSDEMKALVASLLGTAGLTIASIKSKDLVTAGSAQSYVDCVVLYDALLRVHTGTASAQMLQADATCAWESMMVTGCKRHCRSTDCPRCLQKAKWGAQVKGIVPLVRVGCTPTQLDRVKPLP